MTRLSGAKPGYVIESRGASAFASQSDPSTSLRVGKGPVELAPGDTTWCAGINILGSTPDGPYDPDRPRITDFNAGFCAASAKQFPVRFDGTE